MKVSDLMIGDWVIRKGVPEEPMRLYDMRATACVAYLDQDGRGVTEKFENIEPITLTNDILEKNGFKKSILNIDCVQYNCYEVGYETYLVQNYDEDVAYTLGSLYYDSESGYTLIGFAYINHVHKLQHLMNDGICNKIEMNFI